MSIRALNWAWEQKTGSPTAKAILAALADLADETHSCWPSMVYLADRVEVSERTVQRCLSGLETAGYIQRQRRYVGYGKRSTDRYVLSVGQVITGTCTALDANMAPNDEKAPPLDANCGIYIETPEKIDKSIFIEGEPSAGTASQPDPEISTIDAKLAKIHPALSVGAICARLKVAKAEDVDVLYATQTLLSRASRTVRNPVAFVATGIDRAPDAWHRVLPGFEPGSDVSGELSPYEARVAREQQEARACLEGDHDWGPKWWVEFNRGYCLRPRCEVLRRHVDPEFAALEDLEFERKYG